MMIFEEGTNYYYVRHSAAHGNTTILLDNFTFIGPFYFYDTKLIIPGEIDSKLGIFYFDVTKDYPTNPVKGLILKTEAELAAYGTFKDICNSSIYILNGQLLTIIAADNYYEASHTRFEWTLEGSYVSCVKHNSLVAFGFLELSEDDKMLTLHTIQSDIGMYFAPIHYEIEYTSSTVYPSFDFVDTFFSQTLLTVKH